MSDTKEKDKKKKSKLIPIAVSALLALAAGGGACWYFLPKLGVSISMGGQPPAAQVAAAPVEAPIPDPVFLELEPFTVTLRNDVDSRVLYIGLTIRMEDQASRARVQRYLPLARSRVLMELNGVSPNALADRASIDKLRANIKRTLSEAFSPEREGQRIAEVLITSMVTQ